MAGRGGRTKRARVAPEQVSTATTGSTSVPRGVRALALWLVGLGLAVVALEPIVRTTYLPLVDLPQHTWQVALWRAHGDDAYVARNYQIRVVTPYVAAYVLWRGIAALGLSVEDAGRVLVALGILGIPASLLVLLCARGRPAYLAVLAFPFVYNHALAWGFLPFYLSLSWFLLAVAAFALWEKRGGLAYGGLATWAGVLTASGHAFTALMWGLTCGTLALLDPGPWRRRLVRLAPLLPVGAALGIWRVVAWADTPGGGEADAPPHVLFGPHVLNRLRVLDHYLVGGFTAEAQAIGRYALLLVLLAGLGGLGEAFWRSRTTQAETRRAAWRRVLSETDAGLLAAAASALILYCTFAEQLGQFSWLHGRFAPFALLLGVASLAPVRWPAGRGLTVAMSVVIALGVYGRIGAAFQEFERQMGDARGLFASVPVHRSALRPEGAPTRLPPFVWPVLDHVATYAAARSLGPPLGKVGVRLVLPAPDGEVAIPAGRLQLEGARTIVFEPTGPVPDYLLFHSSRWPPEQIPLAGVVGGGYWLQRRTGGLNLYGLTPARP